MFIREGAYSQPFGCPEAPAGCMLKVDPEPFESLTAPSEIEGGNRRGGPPYGNLEMSIP
jgi:hypothetical protein